MRTPPGIGWLFSFLGNGAWFALIAAFFLSACGHIVTMRNPTAVVVAKVTEFSIDNGYILSGQINEAPKSDAVAIFFHGRGVQDRWQTLSANSTLDGKPSSVFRPLAEDINQNGISTVVFDKRGYKEKNKASFGEIEKTINFDTTKADANAVLEYVESLDKFKKIYLIGYGDGAVVASELSFDRPKDKKIKGLILMSGVATKLNEPGSRKTLLERASEFSRPVLLLHGELDQNALYTENALPLFSKLSKNNQPATLKSFPKYGQAFSPKKNNVSTLGPLQPDAIREVERWLQAN